jgi:multicomponent Na+:H+ antiporter subunit A
MDIAFAIFGGFGAAALAPLVVARTGRYGGFLLALVPAAIFAFYVSLASGIADGETAFASWTWVEALGVELSFHIDGLALLFGLLISGIGTLVVVYAAGYMAGDPQLGRFYLYLLSFMGAMLGLTAADNIIALFVFWELTSVTSYLLIGYKHDYEKSRSAALQALIVTGGGGLALLAGLVLIGVAAETQSIAVINQSGDLLRDHDLYRPILILVLIGAATKSAQFPFHFWLPGAMEAPTPVSAYLHSATMVKAGVYLLARFYPSLSGTTEWTVAVSVLGGVTMLVGAYLALNQYDLKRILAYTTVSALGTLVMLLGMGGDLAIKGMATFLLAHALYKGALFMMAGSVDHETGTRDVRELGGLFRAMPITGVIAVVGCLSLAGFPPLFSFIGKEVLVDAALESEWGGQAFLVGILLLASPLLVIAAGVIAIRPFFGAPVETPKHAHEAPMSMWAGPGLLALASVALGLAPVLGQGWLVRPAAQAIAGEPISVSLALWHGFNLPLAFSALTIALGISAFLLRGQLRAITSPVEDRVAGTVGPERGYDGFLAGLKWGAARQTHVLQHGRLRRYVATTAIATVALLAVTALANGGFPLTFDVGGVQFYEWFFGIFVVAAGVLCAVARNRFFAVTALGVVGVGVAVIFLLFGAPDLAMTQLLVDTLTVILFVLVFYHLPGPMLQARRGVLIRDAGIALAVGAVMTVLVLGVTHQERPAVVSEFFAAQAYLEAFGKNVVNVILVDFRVLDTLGEIVVLGAAALGVYALLKLRPRSSEGDE